MNTSTLDRFQPRTGAVWLQSPGASESQDVKELAKYLCKAHTSQRIEDDTFALLLEYLLSFYVSRSMEERLFKKSIDYDRHFSRFLNKHKVF